CSPHDFPGDVFVEGPVRGSARLKDGEREGPVTELPGFAEGKWIVQDLASHILVDRFSKILRSSHGEGAVLLDLCAAPGGKSVAMACEGFQVTASDRDRSRLRLVDENARRTRAKIQIEESGEAVWDRDYSAIWIDAPCSGSGILRRHPDVRWIRKEPELEGLKKTQRGLLEKAFSKLPPGGLLFYSVCSLFKE